MTVAPTGLTTEPTPSSVPAEPPSSPLATFPLPPPGGTRDPRSHSASPWGPALRCHRLPGGADPDPLPPTPFPLPADPCYSPLGIASLPDSSFSASASQEGHPAPAGRLHHVSPGQELQGWAPPADVFPGLPSQPPFLQLDLLQPTNLTGGCCVAPAPLPRALRRHRCHRVPRLCRQGWCCRGQVPATPSSPPSSCSSAPTGRAGTTTDRSPPAASRSPRCCLCRVCV